MGLTGSDNYLTEEDDLGWSGSAQQHAILGIAPSLSPPHVWVHLDEFWWMLQLAGWGVSPISTPIDSCTQWDLDQAQIDSTYSYNLSLLGNCAPRARFPVFVINKAQFSSSKLVRVGLKSCCYCIVYYFVIKKSFGGKIYGVMLFMCGWWLSSAYEV